MMKREIVAPLLLVVGLLLLMLGMAWVKVAPTSVYWGDAQAQEYTDASRELHSASHAPGHSHEHDHANLEAGDPHVTYEQRLASARIRFAKIKGDLDNARSGRSGTAKALMAGGIVAVLAGVFLHLMGRQAE